MASVKHNIIANLSGNAWTALMGFVFVPVYLHYLGAEGFGLIGFFATISGILALLDVGFGAAATRQLARLDLTDPHDAVTARSLVRTLEWLFWGAALVLGCIVIALAPLIASRWLNTQHLDNKTVADALRLMGLTIIIQWPIAFYSGCLMGLQRQVRSNVLGAAIGTLRGAGGSLVLWLVSPTVFAFFSYQLVVALINVIAARQMLWSALPKASVPAVFSLQRVREIGQFALGMVGTNIIGLTLSQLDKVILSTLLSLENFGHYMLASAMSVLVLRLAGPVYNAVYPRLTEVVARHEPERLYEFYRRSSQLLTFIVIPFALLIAFFSQELVTLWTHNSRLGAEVRWTLTWLVLSSAASGIMSVNGATLLAHGNLSKTFRASLAVAVLIFPVTYMLTKTWGLEGAAIASLILALVNQAFLLLAVRAVIPVQLIRQWLLHSLTIPIAACAIVYTLTALYLGHEPLIDAGWVSVFPIAAAYAICMLIVGLILKTTRRELFAVLRIRPA